MPSTQAIQTSSIKLAQTLFCALSCGLAGSGTGLAAARPNFVFFLTDDQPYNGMGCMGNPVIETPNMDRLAAEGVLFDRAFVTTKRGQR